MFTLIFEIAGWETAQHRENPCWAPCEQGNTRNCVFCFVRKLETFQYRSEIDGAQSVCALQLCTLRTSSVIPVWAFSSASNEVSVEVRFFCLRGSSPLKHRRQKEKQPHECHLGGEQSENSHHIAARDPNGLNSAQQLWSFEYWLAWSFQKRYLFWNLRFPRLFLLYCFGFLSYSELFLYLVVVFVHNIEKDKIPTYSLSHLFCPRFSPLGHDYTGDIP